LPSIARSASPDGIALTNLTFDEPHAEKERRPPILWGPYICGGEFLYCGYLKPKPWELKARHLLTTPIKTLVEGKSCSPFPLFCRFLIFTF
jgi:hypothetical protein